MTAMSFSMATTRALDDGALGEIALGEGLFQESGKILPGRLHFALLALKLLVGRDLWRPLAPAPVGWHCICRPRPPRSSRAGRRVTKAEGDDSGSEAARQPNDKRAHPEGRTLSAARDRAAHIIDGRPERGFYIQIGGVEQVSVGRRPQRRIGPRHVARVAPPEVGEHLRLVDIGRRAAAISSARRRARVSGEAVT